MWGNFVILALILAASHFVAYSIGHSHGYDLARKRSRGEGGVPEVAGKLGRNPLKREPVHNKAMRETIEQVERSPLVTDPNDRP